MRCDTCPSLCNMLVLSCHFISCIVEKTANDSWRCFLSILPAAGDWKDGKGGKGRVEYYTAAPVFPLVLCGLCSGDGEGRRRR